MKPADRVRTKALAVLAERLPGRQPVETVAKRSRTAKTFDLGAGVRHLSQTVGPQHYLDGSQWEEIDLAFADRAAGLVSDKAAGVVTVFKDRIGWRHESRAGGWWAEIELIEVDGKKPKVKKPKENETSILFPDVADGVEVEIVLLREGAEAFKNFTRPTELAWRITQSANSQARINTNPKGNDAAGDALELIASFTDGIYRERWTGRVSKIVDPASRKRGWVDTAVLPVRVDASITENVGAGADDGYEVPNFGYWNTNAAVIGFGYYSTYFQHTGIRFQTLGVPTGSMITAATLTLNVTSDGGAIGKLYADNVDDAAAWSNSNKPSGITKTTANAAIDAAGTGIQAFDILSVVQEVLGRGGWVSGNDFRLGIFKDGYGARVRVESFDAVGTDEPQLDITYTAGGGGTSATPTTAALTTTKFAPTIRLPKLATPPTKTLATTAYAPGVLTPRTVTPTTASLALTSFAPSAIVGKTVTPGKATLALAAFAPTVQTPRVTTPTTKALALTAFAPAVVLGTVTTPPAAALTVAEFAPSVATPRTVTPGTTSLATTGFAPTVGAPRTAVPGPASLAATAFAPTVAAPRTATPPTVGLTLIGYAPTIATPRTVTTGTANTILTGFAPSVNASVSATPATRTLTLTGFPPTVNTPREATHFPAFAPGFAW